MTDTSATGDETPSNVGPAPVTNVSGGVNLTADRVNVGEDVVGRDKIVQNIYIPTDAAGGLVALRELMQRSSDVRIAVIAFQTDFQAAHEQVDLLGNYKDLHDLLHHLQFHCYNGLVQAESYFPAHELTRDDLTDYALTLEDIVVKLRQVAARSVIPKHETAWIDKVSLAKTDLGTAIETLDEKLLKRVIWNLSRLLATQPAHINTLLNHAARTLRLPALLDALARIWDNLRSLDLDPDKVSQFQTGVEALRQLDRKLTTLVNDHDGWQSVDVELRRIEGTLEHDLIDLEMSWPDVKLQAEPLYLQCLDDWALALKKESVTLDEVLTANNPAKVKRSFRSFQRRATERFFQVDLELKSLCDKLSQIGAPLASVLRMIE